MSKTRRRSTARLCALGALAIALIAPAAPSAAAPHDVVVDEVIDCTVDTSCADVFEVRCPQPSRYLCANVENTATVGASEKHFFHLSSVGTAPAAFVGVGGMTSIDPEDDRSVCLTKPETSAESALRGLVTVTRTFSGGTILNGPDTYRLTAFCVSDDDGANATVVTLRQDQ